MAIPLAGSPFGLQPPHRPTSGLRITDNGSGEHSVGPTVVHLLMTEWIRAPYGSPFASLRQISRALLGEAY
jgi:hypothetical protein